MMRQPWRTAAAVLGILTAGAVIAAAAFFAVSAGIKIFGLAITGEASAIIVLVQVLEVVAITLAAAALVMEIQATLVTGMNRAFSASEVVTVLRQLESKTEGILIPTVIVYSTLRVMEFALKPNWPADPDGWVEPVAFSGLILLSLLIHRVMSQPKDTHKD